MWLDNVVFKEVKETFLNSYGNLWFMVSWQINAHDMSFMCEANMLRFINTLGISSDTEP